MDLLTKIAVVVLDVMILKMASTTLSRRLTTHGGSCGTLVRGSFFYLPSQPRQFSNLDFGFSNSPNVPPNCPKFVQSPIFYLVNYYGGNWKVQNSPNSPKILPIHPKISQFTQKSPNFQSRCQSPFSKVQKLSNLKATVPDRPL